METVCYEVQIWSDEGGWQQFAISKDISFAKFLEGIVDERITDKYLLIKIISTITVEENV